MTTFIFLLQTLIDKTGIEHALQNGKEMDLCKRGDSLFIVRRGSVTLLIDGYVYKQERAGNSFGETNFIKGEPASSNFSVVSDCDGTLLVELRRR